MNQPEPQGEHRAYRIIIYAIAGGILAFAAAQTLYALSIGNRQLLKDGTDWIYDVLLYGLAAAVFGRGEKAEKLSALLIAAILAAAGISTIYDLYDKIRDPRPVELFVEGFSAASAVVIAILVAGALLRFRNSENALIQATWLSSRNDILKTMFYSALGLALRVSPSRWPEYALDVLAVILSFQAAWMIVAKALRERRAAPVGGRSESL